jgi:hypothetical protein|tara:strand:- start:1187 stop:1453 length:267 start_codon:yes stop_codon:yes gene_type:complete
MIEKCMRNTYEVLINKKDMEDFLEKETNNVVFYGYPPGMTLEDIDEMIEFFEETEEYEKCGDLVKYRNLRDLDIFLEDLRIKNGFTLY